MWVTYQLYGAVGDFISQQNTNEGEGEGSSEPASEKTARDVAKQIEKDLGKDARREFHDAKRGGPDRTMDDLKADAQDLYNAAGKPIPGWLK